MVFIGTSVWDYSSSLCALVQPTTKAPVDHSMISSRHTRRTVDMVECRNSMISLSAFRLRTRTPPFKIDYKEWNGVTNRFQNIHYHKPATTSSFRCESEARDGNGSPSFSRSQGINITSSNRPKFTDAHSNGVVWQSYRNRHWIVIILAGLTLPSLDLSRKFSSSFHFWTSVFIRSLIYSITFTIPPLPLPLIHSPPGHRQFIFCLLRCYYCLNHQLKLPILLSKTIIRKIIKILQEKCLRS